MDATSEQCRSKKAVAKRVARNKLAPPESNKSAVAQICCELGEHEANACLNIKRIVDVIGIARAQKLVQRSKAVESNGGMMLPDGSRRRTLGGVFFTLVRDTVEESERYRAWPWERPMTPEQRRKRRRKARKARKARRSTPSQPTPTFCWQEALEFVGKATQVARGVATSMKITVIGRPGPILQQGQAVLTVLDGPKVPTLPRGLPKPPALPRCAVLIAAKQWRKVADAIKDEQDALIVQGVPTLDSGFNGLTVLATSVTTKSIEKAKRATQEGNA